MANINRRWRRVVAIGCTHGEHLDPRLAQQVLDFTASYKPEVRFHLGDVADTAAFRSGAIGTPDEAADPQADCDASIRFMEQYRPNRISWGNHDWRLVELARHPRGLVAFAAAQAWEQLQSVARKLRAKTVPYDYEHGWFEEGGHYWGHGYWYNVNALRDHAEFLGGPVVMAHLHRRQQLPGRTRKDSMSFCVGTLADGDKMTYSRRRRATSEWGPGLVFGEMCETESRLWLVRGEKRGLLYFPPGLL